jgi:hypothetical protein
MKAALLPVVLPSKARPKSSQASIQAKYLQDLIVETTQGELKPAELSGLARAWCDLQEERRKLAMRPLPRPIDTTKIPKRGSRSRAAAPVAIEPTEPSKAA